MTHPHNSIHSLLADAKARFAGVSTSVSLDAQLLMAHVLETGRAQVIAYPERLLTPEQAAQFEALVARRATGEPIAYIFGRRAFYDREFRVSSAVLIPRPETELLVEMAIESAQAARPDCTAADIGTGSGAIAVTFAAHVRHAQVHAVDVSPAALAVAATNAAASGVTVTFHQGDLLRPLLDSGVRLDLLLANLPYIASDEVPTLDVSRHEPTLALDGGPDGLDLIRIMMRDAPEILRPNALVLLEIGAAQSEAAAQVVRDALPAGSAVEIVRDLAGLDRIIRAVTP